MWYFLGSLSLSWLVLLEKFKDLIRMMIGEFLGSLSLSSLVLVSQRSSQHQICEDTHRSLSKLRKSNFKNILRTLRIDSFRWSDIFNMKSKIFWKDKISEDYLTLAHIIKIFCCHILIQESLNSSFWIVHSRGFFPGKNDINTFCDKR